MRAMRAFYALFGCLAPRFRARFSLVLFTPFQSKTESDDASLSVFVGVIIGFSLLARRA